MEKPLNHLAWVITVHGKLLHCVPDLIDDTGLWHDDFLDEGSRHARTLCGFEATFVAPGIFARTGAPRCDRCCDAAGFATGKGTPLNETAEAQKTTRR